MPFVIRDDEGYLHFDAMPPHGKPYVFDTKEAATKHLESGNWHMTGSTVVEIVGPEEITRDGRWCKQLLDVCADTNAGEMVVKCECGAYRNAGVPHGWRDTFHAY